MPASRTTTEIRPVRLLRPLRVSHTTVTTIETVHLCAELRGTVGEGVVALGPWRVDRSGDVADLAGRLAAQALGSTPEPELLRNVLAPWWSTAPAACQLAEMCVLDLVGRQHDRPLWQVLDLPEPAGTLLLWQTLSVGEDPPAHPMTSGPERLKVKLGGSRDADALGALRGRGAEVVVDVNRGWTAADLPRLLPLLHGLRLLALEDPVRDRDLLPGIRAALPGVPVILDEGVDDLAAVDAALAAADGVNLKPLKMGGLLPCIDAAGRARRAGKHVMLGCFVEPSSGIAYSATLSGLVDWHDLDGHTWLEPGWPTDRLDLDTTAAGTTRAARP